MMNELSSFINSIGAIAEMSGVMLKELLRNGFTREEAVTIISDFLTAMISREQSNSEEK